MVVMPTRPTVHGRLWPITSETGVGKNVNEMPEVAVEQLAPVVDVLVPEALRSCPGRTARTASGSRRWSSGPGTWRSASVTGSPGMSRGMKKLMVMRGPRGEQVEGEPLQQVLHRAQPASVSRTSREPMLAGRRRASRPPSGRRGRRSRSRGGRSSVQRAITCGQRGLNRQPAGGAIRLGGSPLPRSWPSARRLAPVDPVRVGRGLDQQSGVRVRRALGDGLAVAALDHPAGVHDQRLVGEVAGRRDVVGDVEDGQVEPVLAGPAAGSARRAGSTRPAWTPARRPAAPRGRRRARGRWRPAGAGRRTARAGTCPGSARAGSAAPG